MFLRPRASAVRTSESTLTLSATGWIADVNVGISLAATAGFLAVCLVAVWWIFRTGWRLKV